MRSALVYLSERKFINSVREFFRKPVRLIYVIVLLALAVFVIFAGNAGAGESEVFRPKSELVAIADAFFTFVFLLSVVSGFSTGMTVFTMSDVNFLFAGPVGPLRVLFHGMVQQLGKSILIGLVIIFQYTPLKMAYNIGFIDIFCLIIGYTAIAFYSGFIGMFIYASCSGRNLRRKVFKTAGILICVSYAAYLVVPALENGEINLNHIIDASNRFPFPVSGWIAMSCYGWFGEMGLESVICIFLTIALTILMVFILSKTDQDYYEDVLQSTETAFTAKMNSDKVIISDNVSNRKIRTGRIGIGNGTGAKVFYHKHLIEEKRAGSFILSGSQLLFALISVFFGFFTRKTGIASTIAFAEYLQIFSVSISGFNREMNMPFIYLVPEKSFKKLLWSMSESFRGFILSGLIIFIPVGLLQHFDVMMIATLVVTHISFSFLFLVGNVVFERLFGNVKTKGLALMFFFLLAVLMVIPGIVLMIVADLFIGSTIINFTAMYSCNFILSLLCLFLCRNILDTTEFLK